MIRRSLVLLLAYLAAAFVSSIAVVVISGLQQGPVVWSSQFKLILPIVLILGLPVAWIPLAVALALALRLWRSRFVATLCAFAFTAFVLLTFQGSVVNNFLSVAVSPLDPPLWRQLLDAVPYAVLVGLLGGIVFWAIAFRGKNASQPLRAVPDASPGAA